MAGRLLVQIHVKAQTQRSFKVICGQLPPPLSSFIPNRITSCELVWPLEALYSRLHKLFAAESVRAGLSVAGPDGTETTYAGDVDNISRTS